MEYGNFDDKALHRIPVNKCSDFNVSRPNEVPAIFDIAFNKVALLCGTVCAAYSMSDAV